MKNLRTAIVFFLFISFATRSLGQITIPIYKEAYLEQNAACPKTKYSYWVDRKSHYGIYEWKISGGSFIYLGQKVTSISFPNVSDVTVEWDNISSKNGKAPTGNITLKIYKKNPSSAIAGTGKHSQKIKSLKDIIPPDLECDPSSTDLDYGVKNIKVFIYKGNMFYYPGIVSGGGRVPVSKYEWKIPKGWKVKSGQNPTPSGTYITDNPIIDLITDDKNGGDVMLRGVNDCYGSGDYSLYTKLTFTRSGLVLKDYPATVPLGESKTYIFSVKMDGASTFNWLAPSGWSINGGSNSHVGGKSVRITTGRCVTNEKVKVKISNTSLWTEFPTVMKLPTINISSGTITQYQTVLLSLNNISNDKIASVEWFVNGASVGKVNNKSALNYQFSFYGQAKISASLTLKGCMSVSIPAIATNVKKAPDPILSGPSAICDQATYTVENLPPGAQVQWQVHPELYTYGQTNNSISVSKQSLTSSIKEGWIKATVLGTGKTLRKEDLLIWKSGITQTEDLLVGQLDASGGQVEAVYPIQDLGKNFQWSASNNWEATIQGYYFTGFSGSPQSGTSSSVYITVRFDDPCGKETIIYREFELPSSYGFTLSPNPAGDVVTLRLMETDRESGESILSTARSMYEIQLWSGMTMLRSYKTNEPTFQIPVAGLPAGLYFVRLVKDGEVHTEKLIKN